MTVCVNRFNIVLTVEINTKMDFIRQGSLDYAIKEHTLDNSNYFLPNRVLLLISSPVSYLTFKNAKHVFF